MSVIEPDRPRLTEQRFSLQRPAPREAFIMIIFVKSLTGKAITLNLCELREHASSTRFLTLVAQVDPFGTVRTLKGLIYEKEGVDPSSE